MNDALLVVLAIAAWLLIRRDRRQKIEDEAAERGRRDYGRVE